MVSVGFSALNYMLLRRSLFFIHFLKKTTSGSKKAKQCPKRPFRAYENACFDTSSFSFFFGQNGLQNGQGVPKMAVSRLWNHIFWHLIFFTLLLPKRPLKAKRPNVFNSVVSCFAFPLWCDKLLGTKPISAIGRKTHVLCESGAQSIGITRIVREWRTIYRNNAYCARVAHNL